jgi:Domain of unknown function DUF29.
MAKTPYEVDVIAWAQEQAALLRAGRLDEIDAEHIADEIEDVARTEIRELAKRVATLLGYLIEHHFSSTAGQPDSDPAVRRFRHSIVRRVQRTPSLKIALTDSDFWADAWDDAVLGTANDLHTVKLPAECPWSPVEVLGP